jgi:hypothetical protein
MNATTIITYSYFNPLKDRFPRLFVISTQKEDTVASVWNPVVGEEHWRLLWRRRFFVWEEDLVEELKISIGHILLMEEEDRWCWRPDQDAGFTVKSAYRHVSNLSGYVGPLFDSFGNLFEAIWKCPAPSKVSGFIWQALHNRIPTKDNLLIRRIIQIGEACICPLCGKENETAPHLFIYCKVARQVWMGICSWLNIPCFFPHNLVSILNFLRWEGEPKANKGRLMIGGAVIWKLWNFRNSILFDNGNGTVAELVESVKVVSWKWMLARSKMVHCLFYEWRAEPNLCLKC